MLETLTFRTGEAFSTHSERPGNPKGSLYLVRLHQLTAVKFPKPLEERFYPFGVLILREYATGWGWCGTDPQTKDEIGQHLINLGEEHWNQWFWLDVWVQSTTPKEADGLS